MESAQIGLIGDLHSVWGDQDVAYFNASEYQLLLFTGDLGASTRQDGQRIATSISRIERDVLVMPGNNDAAQSGTLGAELAYRRGARALLRDAPPGRQPSARLCGYSSHPFEFTDGTAVTVIAGRPFSFGGRELWFPELLERDFGVASLDASKERIVALARSAPTRDLIVLSHNGPAGFGAATDAIWGNDFSSPGGDWGEPDLADALAEIERGDRRVLAVVAGHMHSPTRAGTPRRWLERKRGTLYVNPARVPRVFEQQPGRRVRHHVALWLGADGARAECRLVEERRDGQNE